MLGNKHYFINNWILPARGFPAVLSCRPHFAWSSSFLILCLCSLVNNRLLYLERWLLHFSCFVFAIWWGFVRALELKVSKISLAGSLLVPLDNWGGVNWLLITPPAPLLFSLSYREHSGRFLFLPWFLRGCQTRVDSLEEVSNVPWGATVAGSEFSLPWCCLWGIWWNLSAIRTQGRPHHRGRRNHTTSVSVVIGGSTPPTPKCAHHTTPSTQHASQERTSSQTILSSQ